MYRTVYSLFLGGSLSYDAETNLLIVFGLLLALQALLLLVMFGTKLRRRKRKLSIFIAMIVVAVYLVPFIYSLAGA